MSSLSEIRAAVAEQERLNNRLRNELATLSNGISRAQDKWNNLASYINNTLQNGNNRMVDSHDLTLQAYELQCQIEEMYKLYKNVELANKKIREAKNKIYYDFANYRSVRKIVEAMLNNIEVTFVSDETIAKAVEIEHLQLPDYWLTCALLSIMAWKNDDRQAAQKALERAYKLDKKCTSIFFFAFHLRIGKEAVALKWFADYASCARTGEDQKNILLMFAIVNKTLAENCDERLVSEVSSFIDKLIKEDLKRGGYNEDDIVERIRYYLGAYRANDPVDYPMLANYCKEISLLKEEMMLAKSNINVLDFIMKVTNVTSHDKNNFLNAFIDDLIARTNNSEKEVANDIKYNEMVIDYQGHVEEAKQAFDDWKKHNETEFEMISEMIDWVYKGNDDDVNPTIRQMMFVLTKALTEKAVDLNTDYYRNRFKRKLAVKINEYESVADLGNPSSEHGKISDFFKKIADERIAEEKIWPAFIWFGVGVAATAGAIALSTPALFVGTVAGIFGGVAKIIMTAKNKKRIAEDCAIRAEATKMTLGKVAEEFAAYESQYKEYDNYYNEIKEKLAAL